MEKSSVDVHSQNRESNTGKNDPAGTFLIHSSGKKLLLSETDY
jgi:hypothetical protein